MAKKKSKKVQSEEQQAVEASPPLPESLGRAASVVDVQAPLRIRTPLSPVVRDGVVLCYVEPGADLGFLR